MHSFGYWIRRQRKALDLTQAQLAELVGCAVITVKKMESEERRPSQEMAELLAKHLGISEDKIDIFLAAARGKLLDAEPPVRTPLSTASPQADSAFTMAQATLSELPPLVGRDSEWETLLSIWNNVMEKGAQCVLIEGEAGIGKSRLAQELIAWTSVRTIAHAHSKAYAAVRDMAYRPVSDWIQSPSLRQVCSRLAEVWLTEISRIVPNVLAQFPNLPRPEPLQESWQRLRLFEALAQPFLMHEDPLLLVLDDVQWSDSETLLWLEFLLDYAHAKPILVIGTVRSEDLEASHQLHKLQASLRHSERISTIQLHPLSETETLRLVEQTIGTSVKSDLGHEIFQSTDGNPLFVVESANSFESNIGSKEENKPTAATLETLPPKVQAVLSSRVRNLSDVAQKIAWIASVLGRSFAFDIIQLVLNENEDELVDGLEELWQRRIIHEQSANVFDFTHDRIRDVVYAEISPMRRRQMHKNVAEVLTAQQASDADTISSQIAMHYEEAGLVAEAIPHYIEAMTAEEEMLAFEPLEALAEKTLGLLDALPRTSLHLRQAYRCYSLLQDGLIPVSGFHGEKMDAFHLACNQIVRELDDDPITIEHLLWESVYLCTMSDMVQSMEALQEALPIVERRGKPATSVEFYIQFGHIHCHLGNISEANRAYKKALLAIEQCDEGRLTWTTITTCKMVEALWLGGYFEEAHEVIVSLEQNIYELTINFNAQLFYSSFVLHTFHRMGDIENVVKYAEKNLQICNQHDGFLLYKRGNLLLMAWAHIQSGQIDKGIEQMEYAMSDMNWPDMTGEYYLPYYLSIFADGLAMSNQTERAIDTAQDALTISARTGDRVWDAELHRQIGMCRKELGNAEEQIEEPLTKAVTMAQQQGSRFLELRAAMSLAKFQQEKGAYGQAFETLQTTYTWFADNAQLAYLKNEKALLKELKSLG